ncbi:MAG: MFS transporter [Halobacteriota archaeon]|jgi:YQGE family putative transporter
MNRLMKEYNLFLSCPRDMRILLLTNMLFAFVLPVIEIFVAAYVMRNSHAVSKVLTYQLAIYTATPAAFLINGFLLRSVSINHLYSAAMLLSGIAMILMMSSPVITMSGIAISGSMMGLATGLFWANRGFLVLSTTNDSNRNYYYGLESFFLTFTSVIVPMGIGLFIAGTTRNRWLNGNPNNAYRIVSICVIVLTVLASIVVHFGRFENPPLTTFVFFRFDPLWHKMLVLAALKGLVQGYIVTAPAMLIMMLVGQEGTLGTIQAVGGIVSSFFLYGIGRVAKPNHRVLVFSIGLLLFFIGTVVNAALFNATGVIIFMACLILAKPILDLAYFPIQFLITETVSRGEGKNQYAYILNHECGLFAGRALGCGLFLVLATWISDIAALKYALPIVAVLQLASIWIASRTLTLAAQAQANALKAVPADEEVFAQ